MNCLRTGLACSVLLIIAAIITGCGKPPGRGEIQGAGLPAQAIADKEARQASSSPVEPDDNSQILFGDLHVHTTFSPSPSRS